MKFAKKLISILLVVLMLTTMAVPALADTPITITLNNSHDGHDYKAYQIFTGTLDGTSGILTNIEWGDNIVVEGENGLLAKLTAAGNPFGTAFAGITADKPEAVAKVIGGWSYNEAPVKNFADAVKGSLTGSGIDFTYASGKYTAAVSEVGYYFIEEVVDTDPEHNHQDGYTDYLLMVTNSTAISPKTSKPSFEMTIDYRENGTYGKGVDVQVDDPVYIRMTSKLPELYADYHQYFLRYELTLPDGMVFPAKGDRMDQLYLLHGNGSITQAEASRYEIKYYYKDNLGGTPIPEDNLSVGQSPNMAILTTKNLCDGIMNLNDTLVFKTKAIMDTPKVYGKGGEGNAYLGNVLNGAMYYSNNMNEKAPAGDNIDIDDVSSAKMTDTASVYSYHVQFQKIDSANPTTKLENAEFKLYRNITTETETKAMYAILVNEDGTPFTEGSAGGVITGWTDTAANASIVTSDVYGNFYFKGVDAAAYHLEEVAAPAKYNKMDEPVLVTVAATITNHDLTALSCIADGATTVGTENDGTIPNVPIRNTLGSALPATGGMGTTIFYAAGAVLLLGSVAAFAVKKRNEEE